MPIIHESSFRPALLLGPHLQTIIPAMFPPRVAVSYRRERIDTPDGDFLDLDWLRSGSRRVAILQHGLEGSSGRPYIRGMAAALRDAGWDVLAWNFRGCGGQTNRTLRWYHSGETGDLRHVIAHALATVGYEQVALIGFSLGGNMTLKYLGEEGESIDPRIVGAVTFSVPCDLKSSALRLADRSNRIYMRRFLRTLADKVRRKMAVMPGMLSDEGLKGIATFQEFDDRYTAPLHGFRDAEEYWARSSSRAFLERIRVPALLVNALDDPFLAPPCYPAAEAERSRYFHLETPRSGGHVGFVAAGPDRRWMEWRALEFLAPLLHGRAS